MGKKGVGKVSKQTASFIRDYEVTTKRQTLKNKKKRKKKGK